MAFQSLALGGAAIVLQIIQQYIANPTVAGVPIECENYTEINEADVSQQLIIAPLVSFVPAPGLISQTGKQYITDNIAPKPRTFNLKGFIAPSILELTALSPLLMPTILDKMAKLRAAQRSRTFVKFTTKNHQEILNVGIVSMTFDSIPDIQNRQPISLILREIPVLNSAFNSSSASPVDIQNASSVASATATLTAQELSPEGILIAGLTTALGVSL